MGVRCSPKTGIDVDEACVSRIRAEKRLHSTVSYTAKDQWGRLYSAEGGIAYPAEAVIRIFKGNFPLLRMPKPKPGSSIVDIGCGDGRHFPLFASLQMRATGTEISEEIVANLRTKLQRLGVAFETIVAGTNAALPFPDASFDYALSWNSCYYMSADDLDFERNVTEIARVVRPGGWLVCSVPKRSCFIFEGSESHEREGFRVIRNDPFGVRNGEVMRCFENRAELETSFGEHFGNFCHADLDMNFFGYAYHWHVFAAERL